MKSKDCYTGQVNANACLEAGGKYLDSIMDPGITPETSSCARLMPPLCQIVGGRVKAQISCDFWCTAVSTMANTSSSCFDDADCAMVATTDISTQSSPTVSCPSPALPTRIAAGNDFVGGLFLSGFCCESISDIIAQNCAEYQQSKVDTYIAGLRSKGTQLGGCVDDNEHCLDTVKSSLKCFQSRAKLSLDSGLSCPAGSIPPVLTVRGCFRDQITADYCSGLGKDLLQASSSSTCLPTVEKMCKSVGGRSINGHSCDFMCDAVRGG